MISGNIKPTSYSVPYSRSPNPVPNDVPSGTEGMLVTCPKTGRIWILTRTNTAPGTPTYAFQQVLPYTANNAITAGVSMENSSGDMLLSRPTGASSGQLNIAVPVSMIGVQSVVGEVDAGGPLVAVQGSHDLIASPYDQAFPNSDQTLTTAGTRYFLSSLEYNPESDGYYSATVTIYFYLASAYTVTAAISIWSAGGVIDIPQSGGVVSSAGGWSSMTISKDRMQLGPASGTRMVVTVKSDTNSVLVKSVSTETFPSTVGTNPQGVRTTNRIIQRVG
jgi:hypothetical protein